MKYFPEIDGLRTIAVIPVVLFHLSYSWIPGGFLGVDIFFVISGCLITHILLNKSHVNPSKYFIEFYSRRVRRIFPALFVMIFSTLLLACLVLMPSDLLELGRSSLAALGFVSNIYFYLNTGYFDEPAEMMPLLHTWSLGVEEQFYLFWPAIFFIIARYSKYVKVSIIGCLFILSLLGLMFFTELYPSLVFYNLPFRVFEFAMGAVIPLLPRIGSRMWVGVSLQSLGLLIILYCYFTISENDPFLGYKTCIPTFAAAMFIFGTCNFTAWNRNPMSSIPMVFIGKLSYSIYLWHWPLITLYKVYVGGAEILTVEKISLLVITFVLSIVSYNLIERPLREPAKKQLSFAFSGILISVIGLLTVIIIQTKGIQSRVPNLDQYSSISTMWTWKNGCDEYVKLPMFERKLCSFGVSWDLAEYKILLWGDSHASQVAPMMKIIAEKHSLSFLKVSESCKPVTDGDRVLLRHKVPVRATKGCLKEIDAISRLLSYDPKIKLLIITGLWRESVYHVYSSSNDQPSFEERQGLMEYGLDFNVNMLSQHEIDILLLGDIPNPQNTRMNCFSKHNLIRASVPDCSPLPLRQINQIHSPSESILERVAIKYENVSYFDVRLSHCHENGCPIYINGDFIYRDSNHIRRNFSDETKLELLKSLGLEKAIDWEEYSNLVVKNQRT